VSITDEERIAALGIAVERYDSALRVKEGENAALRAQLLAVTAERDAFKAQRDELRDAALATARDEVARLDGREKEATTLLNTAWDAEPVAWWDARSAWLAGCKP
jgi:hypothetical protein